MLLLGFGERIVLVIIFLFGFIVYMFIFIENILKILEVLFLISKFFIVILFEVVFCLMGMLVILRFYYFSELERKVFVWVNFFVVGWLVKLLRMKMVVNLLEK